MTETAPPRLAVVIPCYNEAANVAPMVARLDAALAGIAWEAIFVDDDSPDGTAARAKAIAGRDPRVRCIRRIGRRGLASACVEGILSTAAPYVAVIDGDLQHDETILPRMLAALESDQAEIVIGSRNVEGGTKGEGLSPIRRMVSDGGAALANAALPVKVADPMSGFFALPRALFEELAPRLTATGFKILLDILLSAGRPLRVAEIPYTFRAREAGRASSMPGCCWNSAGCSRTRRWAGWCRCASWPSPWWGRSACWCISPCWGCSTASGRWASGRRNGRRQRSP